MVKNFSYFIFVLCVNIFIFQGLYSDEPKPYVVDYVSVEETEEGFLASIFLTNGANFSFFDNHVSTINDLTDCVEIGGEIFFSTEYKTPYLRMYVQEGKYSFLVTVGEGARDFLPKIVDIHQTKSGKYFYTPLVTLSDGSVWEGYNSYIQDKINKFWNVGDTVLFSNYFLPTLINVDVSFREFDGFDPHSGQEYNVDAREVEVKQIKGTD